MKYIISTSPQVTMKSNKLYIKKIFIEEPSVILLYLSLYTIIRLGTPSTISKAHVVRERSPIILVDVKI